LKIIKDYPLLDGLGIARGALGRPWIFDEIKEILCHSERSEESRSNSNNLLNMGLPRSLSALSADRRSLAMTNDYDLQKIKKIMLEHAKLAYKNKKESGILEIRKHLCWYIKGFPCAGEMRKKLVLAKSVKEIKNILKAWPVHKMGKNRH